MNSGWRAYREVAAYKRIRLRECMKTAKAIYYIEETQLRQFEFLNEKDRNKIMQAQKNSCFRTDYEKMKEKGIRFVPYFSEEYPDNLKEIADPPYALYVKGSLPDKKAKKSGGHRCEAVYAVWREICYRFRTRSGRMRRGSHQRDGERDRWNGTQRGSAFGRQDLCCVRIRSGCVLSEGTYRPVRGYFRTGRGGSSRNSLPGRLRLLRISPRAIGSSAACQM